MIQIILINKKGDIIEKKVKNLDNENIYKKCGLSSKKNFCCQYEIGTKNGKIQFWSKNKGNKNIINNNKLPVENMNKICYGNIILVQLNNNNEYINLSKLEFDNLNKLDINNNELEDEITDDELICDNDIICEEIDSDDNTEDDNIEDIEDIEDINIEKTFNKNIYEGNDILSDEEMYSDIDSIGSQLEEESYI